MRAFLGNSGWLLFDKILRMLLGVLVGAWVARYLGPGQYGEISYAVAFIAIFLAVAGLGADGITVRDLARNPQAAPEILGTATYARVLAGLLSLIAAVVVVALTCRGDFLQVWLTAIIGSTLLFQAGDTIDLWFQSKSQSRRTVISKLLAYSLSNGVKVVLILLRAPVIAFALVLMLDAMTAALALLVAYRGFPADRPWRYSRSRVRQLLRDCRPFIVGSFLMVLYLRVDQILVRQTMGERSLGIYAAAIWVLQIWTVVPATLSTSLGPYLARRKAASEALYRHMLIVVSRAYFLMGLVSMLLTYILAPLIVHFIFGNAYEAAIPVMRLYAVTLPFAFLGLAHNLWLFNEGKYLVRVYGAVVAGLCTAAIILLFAPRIGLFSACIAAIFSQAVVSLLINAPFDNQAFRMQLKAITFQ
jgi:O-antigen/teichoic acid export membrane protein